MIFQHDGATHGIEYQDIRSWFRDVVPQVVDVVCDIIGAGSDSVLTVEDFLVRNGL